MPTQSNTSANRYGSIAAEIYDIDKPFGFLPDTRFHLAALAGESGPILEPACGSGRTLIPLLEAGLDACGFDPSEDMLARCRQRCAERGFTPDLSRQRFEDFAYERRFAVILVPGGSFTLIGTYEAARTVLDRFHHHLRPGGRLIVDLTSLSFLANTRDDRRTWTGENGDLLTLIGQRLTTDWFNQCEEHHVRYERWRDGVLVESQIEPMVQRHWSATEFTLALEAAGFGEVRLSGGYEPGRPPRPNDRVITFEARRV
jgi:SAM-dependent methyltransferase